jgi:two-component system, OmpR family, sensor histidine kinase ChvG
MPFDGGRPRIVDEALAGTRALAEQTRGLWSHVWPWLAAGGTRVRRAISGLPVVRWFSRSLARRIVFSNVIGLAILLGGYWYMNQYKDWLVDAKVDSLTAQGEIIAQAIASNATPDGQRQQIDPEAPPDSGFPLAPFRDDGFASLSFSIGPEKVTPILRRLIQPDIRARVYDRDGRLIVDSADFLSKRKLDEPRRGDQAGDKLRTKNLWTRMTEYLFASDLPVLRELDRANGNYYPPVRSAMTGTGTPMLLLNEEGQQIVSYAAPILRARQIHGVLLLSTDPGEIEKVLNKERMAILKLAGLALVTSFVVSMLLAYSVATPIHTLSAAAEAVSRDINARHTLPDFSKRQDEVGQLAQSFGAMTAALFRRIEQSEKFAADVAHELKNPLTAANATAQSLAYAHTDEEREQLVAQIRAELKRLNRLISDVSNASRLDAELALQSREAVDISEVLDNVVSTFRDLLGGTSRTVTLEVVAGDLVVQGQDGRLAQVVTNLIDNAISFSPEDSVVRVLARRDGDKVAITIEDDGPGIDPDKLETVFDRFYTYRPTATTSRGNNSGLGLSISREIIRAHQGKIWAENRYASVAGTRPASKAVSKSGERERLGARFTIQLPARPAPSSQRHPSLRSWRS